MIRVRHLSKSFGAVRAVDDVSFDVERGSIFAFLGTNGAGKSTTIGCVTTVLAPDAGHIEVGGHAVGTEADEVRRLVGVVFQQSLLDPVLTVRENLDLRAAFYGLDRAARRARIGEIAPLIGVDGILDRRYGTLSGGQKRRADIARALAHAPSVLFLDEPTAGLDPASREQVWETVHRLRRDAGLTVFLTTHYMHETEEADQVCVIDAGRIVQEGTPSALRERFSSSILTVTPRDPAPIRTACANRGLTVTETQGVLAIEVDSSATARAILHEHDAHIEDFEFRHGTMDDVFLALTSRTVDA
ncbi:ABC transporter ATP-binding protein [Cellulomonas sp. URHD0024]|uniref:ABC transporter ATP-binding protein n=1 Tax=Cellulomonas sp. URHD0024 TaxID=1302620 RepID=UPI00040A1D08|nr:ABC transporter ATP-binding protein [Cellulomonas sp. URHD0024]